MDTTVADPLVGHVLDGRYRVESKVARGGMATVYLGRDLKLERTVALKVMHQNLVGDEEFVRRFIGEAKAAAALSHPNVVAVFDQGTDASGHVYLAMEYVQGPTLREVLTQRGRLDPAEALGILDQVLGALSAAHRIGLVHRDVKPENVLISPGGHVKVADFGLARAETASRQTKAGMLIGTVAYLAPEQVTSGSSDARTDVYAAGIVLFELLTGAQPFHGETPLAVAYKHVNEVVPLPSSVVPGLPHQLDTLVSAATNHDPARRPADAGAFQAAVGEVRRALPPSAGVAAGLTNPTVREQIPGAGTVGGATGAHTMAIQAPPPPPPTVAALRRVGRRGPWLIGVAAVVIVGLVAWAVYAQTIGQQVRVPTLVGLSAHDAVAKATDDGLRVRVVRSEYDGGVPSGDVVSVTPVTGATVHKGALLNVVLSLGAKPRRVPGVAGMPAAQAEAKLKRQGFTHILEQQRQSTTVDINDAVRTLPPAGTSVSPSNTITLVISLGVQVPNLVNQPADQALQTLQNDGLVPQENDQPVQDGQQPNTVTALNPPPGTTVNPGTVIQVTVAKNNPFCLFFCGDGNGGNGHGHGHGGG